MLRYYRKNKTKYNLAEPFLKAGVTKKNKIYLGFTLIEVMIALFIFSVLSILTMRGLQTTFAAKQKSREALDQLAELEVAYTVLQRDIEQIINRNAQQPTGGLKLSLIVPIDNKSSSGQKASLKTDFGYNRLEFTRTGVSGNLINKKLSDLRRVAYFQDESTIVRHSWRQLDATKDTVVDKRRLLTNVENFNIYFVDEFGRKTDNWEVQPSKSSNESMQPMLELPKGIIIDFSVKNYGNIEWVFALPTVFNKTK